MLHRIPKSVESVMRKTLTTAGKREFNRRIRNPTVNESVIHQRQNFAKLFEIIKIEDIVKIRNLLKNSCDLVGI